MKAKLSTLLMVMVLISMAFVPAVSGNENTNSDKKTLNELDYTKSELQSLYDKYNISENDIKFAKDKLPHYLKGTILNMAINISSGISWEKIIKKNLETRQKYIYCS